MTTNSKAIPEILIVGAGSAGLVLALSLAKNGIPVRIIDKGKAHRIGQRAAGITPRSLELFEALGIVGEIKRHAMDFPKFRMYKMPEGKEVLKEFYVAPKREPTPAFPYVNGVMLGQDTVEGLLRSELEKLGVVIELGSELLSLKQTGEDVEVKIAKHGLNDTSSNPTIETSPYKWVIGADGAKSIVRKQLGLAFLGKTHVETFIVGDIKLEGLPPNTWNLWGDMRSVMTGIRATEIPGLFNLLVGGTGLKLGKDSEIWTNGDALRAFLKDGICNREDIKFGDVVWVGPYRLNIRCVEAFKKGNVLIIGDAGHVHGPAGGQGMNTSIQDAFNLGWKLALVAKGLAPESLLETFNSERLPVVKEMLNITDNLMKKTIHDSNTEEGWDRSGSIDQLSVNYRGSSIVLDEEDEGLGCVGGTFAPYNTAPGGKLHAGDRAPDASGLVRIGPQESAPIRLFELLDPTKHTVLVFAERTKYRATVDSLKSFAPDVIRTIMISNTHEGFAVDADEVYEDRDGHAKNAYLDLNGKCGILAIRPDGIVGARVGSVDALQRYFGGILGII